MKKHDPRTCINSVPCFDCESIDKMRTHRLRHIELHHALDELVADWVVHSKGHISDTSIIELMQWSHAQTINPTEDKL